MTPFNTCDQQPLPYPSTHTEQSHFSFQPFFWSFSVNFHTGKAIKLRAHVHAWLAEPHVSVCFISLRPKSTEFQFFGSGGMTIEIFSVFWGLVGVRSAEQLETLVTQSFWCMGQAYVPNFCIQDSNMCALEEHKIKKGLTCLPDKF